MVTRTRTRIPGKKAELKTPLPVRRRPDGTSAPKRQSIPHRDAGAARVVGIGASAGGLDAFLELLSAIPAETGLAFVLVQHLDPRHDSMLADILARSTRIPAQEVVDGMRIERNNIYVIPPDSELTSITMFF